jgi:hypothetical protein
LGRGGKPLLFETGVFGMESEAGGRYCTWKEAEEGHKAAVETVRRELAG